MSNVQGLMTNGWLLMAVLPPIGGLVRFWQNLLAVRCKQKNGGHFTSVLSVSGGNIRKPRYLLARNVTLG